MLLKSVTTCIILLDVFSFFIWYIFLDRCNYHGRIYLEGDRFVSHDGCNHCMCTLHGTACTEIACSDVTTTPPPSAVGKRKAFNVYLSPFVFMIATISSETTINDYLWSIWNISIVIVSSYQCWYKIQNHEIFKTFFKIWYETFEFMSKVKWQPVTWNNMEVAITMAYNTGLGTASGLQTDVIPVIVRLMVARCARKCSVRIVSHTQN